MSISIPLLLQTPDFGKILLSLRRRITYNLEAVAVLIHEISTHKLKSNLAFVLTWSISIPFLVQTEDFENMLLKSRQRITHVLEAIAVVVSEILTHKLKSNLTFVITLSIPIPFVVQTPDFGKMLLKSRRRITHYLEVVAIVVL